ncbi:transporter [Burkholderia glumae]|uniref:transporter n=1 Tax=Burkholderia glumae TaxID=337 RepID=UPI0001A4AF94|nr:transporter [Burkholderia glumae]ACR28723.1 outer membrane autotransporter [Burkholderia glumae BGR1]UVS87080.1 transporter [Burkholderia glumae]
MKKIVFTLTAAFALLFSFVPRLAVAQFVPGQILTAQQLNSAFAAVTANALPLSGGTLTGPLQGTAATFNSGSFASLSSSGPVTFSSPLAFSSGGTGATTALGATSNLQFQASLSGASGRSVASKLSDVVSILDFPGCDKTGVVDSTACIQAALNSGARTVYIPAGQYRESGLVLPQTVGFTLYGDGPNSVLIQTGGPIRYPTISSNSTFDSHSTIRDLKFDGTAGTGNTIDTSYAQTLDLLNLAFNNVPVGYSSIKLDGNPTTGIYMHDVRAKNIRVYSTTAGKAGIELGAYASDSTIDGFIMNGGFIVNYCLYANVGAQTTMIQNSHPYNAAINVIRLAGNNNDFGFVGNTIDNALGDLFYVKGSARTRISSIWLEAIASGQRGLVLDASTNTNVMGISCEAASVTATSCVAEINGASANRVFAGQVDSASNYATPFNLNGTGSLYQATNSGNSLNAMSAAAGNSPSLSASGADSSIPITLNPKGSGGVVLNFSNSVTAAYYSDTAGELALEVYNISTPSTKYNLNLVKYGGRLLLGGVDDGANKLQVGGSAAVYGNLTVTGAGAMPLYSTAGAAANAPHMVKGTATLASGAATVALSGAAAYTSSTSYACTATDTTAANAVRVSQTSGTSFALSGTGTDVVQFLCAGN